MKRNKPKQNLTLEDIIYSWDGIIAQLEKKNAKIAHFIEDAALSKFDGTYLWIELINVHRFQRKTLEKDVEKIEAAINSVLNEKIRIKFYSQDDSEEESTGYPLSVEKSDIALELLDNKALLRVVCDRLKSVDEEFTEYREEVKDKVAFYDRLSGSENTLDFSQGAKLLNFKNYGRNKLYVFCREIGFLRNRPGTPAHNEPYQRYMDQGLFELVPQAYTVNGKEHMGSKTVLTHKGLERIRKLLDEYTNGE